MLRPNRNKYKEKPEVHICNKCLKEKPFNNDYYSIANHYLFGLAYICKNCEKIRKSLQTKKDRPRANASSKAWQKSNQEKGLCIKCSTKRIPTSNNFCEKHAFQDMSAKSLGTKTEWKFVKDLLVKQDYKCAYTGIPLVLGLNASIDHIKAKSKHPELQHSKDNIIWVDFDINLMKRQHDLEDFIKYCQMVVDHSS